MENVQNVQNVQSNVGVQLEYRVVPVTRYAITRYERKDDGKQSSGSVSQRGIYENADVAFEVATALCKMEHEVNGGEIDDPRIQYPVHPNAVSPMPA